MFAEKEETGSGIGNTKRLRLCSRLQIHELDNLDLYIFSSILANIFFFFIYTWLTDMSYVLQNVQKRRLCLASEILKLLSRNTETALKKY